MKNKNFYIKEIIKNNKIYNKYIILYNIDCGICLKGWEIKSIRYKKINIDNSYIIIKNKEIFLINSNFYPNKFSKEKNIKYSKTRDKKLLIKKKEIEILINKTKNNLLKIIAISIFIKNNKYAKLKIGIVKKNNNFNKKFKEKNIKKYNYI